MLRNHASDKPGICVKDLIPTGITSNESVESPADFRVEDEPNHVADLQFRVPRCSSADASGRYGGRCCVSRMLMRQMGCANWVSGARASRRNKVDWPISAAMSLALCATTSDLAERWATPTARCNTLSQHFALYVTGFIAELHEAVSELWRSRRPPSVSAYFSQLRRCVLELNKNLAIAAHGRFFDQDNPRGCALEDCTCNEFPVEFVVQVKRMNTVPSHRPTVTTTISAFRHAAKSINETFDSPPYLSALSTLHSRTRPSCPALAVIFASERFKDERGSRPFANRFARSPGSSMVDRAVIAAAREGIASDLMSRASDI
jgi:hypothetical protein